MFCQARGAPVSAMQDLLIEMGTLSEQTTGNHRVGVMVVEEQEEGVMRGSRSDCHGR